MAAGKSPTYSQLHPAGLPASPGRISVSTGFKGQVSGVHARKGKLQPVAGLRLSIADCRFGKDPILAAHQHSDQDVQSLTQGHPEENQFEISSEYVDDKKGS